MNGLRTLIAGNRGPFTLDGTRTFLVGNRSVAIIDPGPAVPEHMDAIASAVRGADRMSVLLTHGHPDHSGGAVELAHRLNAPLLGSGLAEATGLVEGEQVETDAGPLVAVATPGHTSDHLGFLWPVGRALFAGDLVLGEGDTTWVAEYPTCVSDYLASLDRVDEMELDVIYPAHGPPLTNPIEAIQRFRAHRLDRIAQARDALRATPDATVPELVTGIYGAALPDAMRPAAEASLKAVLDYIRAAE